MIRAAIESLTRNWLYRRTLVVGHGKGVPLLVSPSAGLKYLFKSIHSVDPILLMQAEEFVREGDVVWDVGANVGLFAFAAASLTGPKGHVYCIEPDLWLVNVLRRTASMQPATSAKVTVIPAAIAQENALRSFAIAKRSRASNHLIEYGRSQTGGIAEEHTVITLSLDWLSTRCLLPRVLKIDVEGAEKEVLSGAAHLIASARPIVLCEVDGEPREWVTEFFHSRNYELFDGECAAGSRVPVDLAPWNTIAIPK